MTKLALKKNTTVPAYSQETALDNALDHYGIAEILRMLDIDKRLTPKDAISWRASFEILKFRENRTGSIYYNQIVKQYGVSPRTLTRAIRKLVHSGWIGAYNQFGNNRFTAYDLTVLLPENIYNELALIHSKPIDLQPLSPAKMSAFHEESVLSESKTREFVFLEKPEKEPEPEPEPEPETPYIPITHVIYLNALLNRKMNIPWEVQRQLNESKHLTQEQKDIVVWHAVVNPAVHRANIIPLRAARAEINRMKEGSWKNPMTRKKSQQDKINEALKRPPLKPVSEVVELPIISEQSIRLGKIVMENALKILRGGKQL